MGRGEGGPSRVGSWFDEVALDYFGKDVPFLLFVSEGKHDEPRTDFGYGTVRWRGQTGVDDSSGVSGYERSWN